MVIVPIDRGRNKACGLRAGFLLSVCLAMLCVLLLGSCAARQKSKPTGETSSFIPVTSSKPLESGDEDIQDLIEEERLGDQLLNENQPNAIPVAMVVPGRPGHVFNPYTQNMVNVEGIPSGTKVRDPHDLNAAHIFYVP